jgi:Ca2+-binding EF-hand superfamily protein
LALLLACSPAMAIAAEDDPAVKPKDADARAAEINRSLGDLLDADQDGAITDQEAVAGAQKLQNEANAKNKTERSAEILAALDDNKDGKLDNAEVGQAVAEQRRERDEIGQRVGEMFDKLDLDTNQVLDPNEFKALIERLGPLGKLMQPRLGQFFNRMDADRNGQISMVESQFAADYFAEQAGMRRKQEAAKKNDKLVQMTQQTLAQLDRNRNGEISTREAKRNAEVDKVFGLIDTDDNKKLTGQEIYKYLETTEAK